MIFFCFILKVLLILYSFYYYIFLLYFLLFLFLCTVWILCAVYNLYPKCISNALCLFVFSFNISNRDLKDLQDLKVAK